MRTSEDRSRIFEQWHQDAFKFNSIQFKFARELNGLSFKPVTTIQRLITRYNIPTVEITKYTNLPNCNKIRCLQAERCERARIFNGTQ